MWKITRRSISSFLWSLITFSYLKNGNPKTGSSRETELKESKSKMETYESQSESSSDAWPETPPPPKAINQSICVSRNHFRKNQFI